MLDEIAYFEYPLKTSNILFILCQLKELNTNNICNI